MRVNPDRTADLLYSLSTTTATQKKALQEIASGRALEVPSDDPAGMAALLRIRSHSTTTDTFVRGVGSLRAKLQMTDSTLGSVVAGLQRVVTLGVQGGTGTLSDSDREAIATEIRGLRENLVNLANSTYDGNYLFAGTEVKKEPFVLDTSTGEVSYNGNANNSLISMGNGREVQASFSGDSVFCTGDADVFGSLKDLIGALFGGAKETVPTATQKVRAALDQVSSQRVVVGNALAQLDESETELNKVGLQLSTQEDEIAGADLSAAITRLLNSETARNAALGAAGQVSRSTLLDYLMK